MKTVKNLFVLLMIGGAFASCGKYEDGPKISLASKKGRMVNEWKLVSVSQNGIALNLAGITWVTDVKKDGSYIDTYSSAFGSYSNTGTWSFSSDKESVTFTENGSSSAITYKILRLKSKELWLEETDGLDKYEYHYEKN